MFHGTSRQNAENIKKMGFQRSADGMLGEGVYLSRDPLKAKGYGEIVLRCHVQPGKTKKIDRQMHPLQRSWQSHGYDSAWVPASCGMVASGLTENCVYDPKRITVVGEHRCK